MTDDPGQVVDGPIVVAVDVGGTLIKGALGTVGGDLVALRRVPTAVRHGPEAVVGQVVQLVAALVDVARRGSGAAPAAVAVVVPGVIDAGRGVVRYASNIGWRDVDLGVRIRDVLDVPVVLGHDARAAAVGESTYGAARGAASFLCLTLGTGIGGSLVLGGVPYPGGRGLAGEIGHIRAARDGTVCGCGQIGCLETLASAAAIRRRYLDQVGTDPTRHGFHAADVLRLAATGTDPVAAAVAGDAVGALGLVLTGVQRVVDLELVVIGGGLCVAGDALIAPLETELAARAAFQTPPRLVISALGAEAGCHGAAVMAWGATGLLPLAGNPVIS